MVELWISNGSKSYSPSVLSGIKWTTHRMGEPSSLQFKYLNSDSITVTEGNAVKMIVDGVNVFFGFIFTMKYDKTGEVDVTAYDQIRYLKNKDTYVIQAKTAETLIRMIATDFSLNIGNIAKTGYILADKIEENQTLMDIIQNALDETLGFLGTLFVLYDDFGKLTLRNAADWKVDYLVDKSVGENFDFSSSINDNTYNQIKLTYDNEETKKREVYIAKSSGNINQWGVLQYFETLQAPNGAQKKANDLLRLYNTKTRTLKVTGLFGDARVRAGCSVGANMTLGNVGINRYMFVESATHTFENGVHKMDLELRGGAINA